MDMKRLKTDRKDETVHRSGKFRTAKTEAARKPTGHSTRKVLTQRVRNVLWTEGKKKRVNHREEHPLENLLS